MESQDLQPFGFDEKEAKVYLSLLKIGPATATEISYDTSIDRTLCYSIFERLMEKGFASFTLQDNVKHFSATPPTRVFEFLKEKTESFEECLPELLALLEQKPKKPTVEIIPGLNGIKFILEDVLNARTDNVLYGSIEKFQEHLPIKLRRFLKELEKRDFKERLLISEGEKALLTSNDTVRILPTGLMFPSTNYIYGEDKMAIIIWTEPITTILIRNKDVVDSHKKHFEFMWSKAKPLDPIPKHMLL